MSTRRPIPKNIETRIVVQCHRRCCLCYYLNQRDEVRRGQIAHLNRDATDYTMDNLVYLCLEHHDEYDSRTSQSKGLTSAEIRHYRDLLYSLYNTNSVPDLDSSSTEELQSDEHEVLKTLPALSAYDEFRRRDTHFAEMVSKPWHYGLGPIANQPEFFAYRVWNGCDGVCLIERIDLPDSRIVIACIQTSGNPGQSVTNAVEELAFQVCERFEVPPAELVWLEHYDHEEEWNWVTFGKTPPYGCFEDPKWTILTDAMWRQLGLRPRKRLRLDYGGRHYESKLRKLFQWP